MNTFDHFRANPANWKLGIFYFCRADPRLLVPKRIRGFGLTLNLARPLAIPFLILLIALVQGVLDLARALGSGGNPGDAIKELLVLGGIAVCYWLFNQWTKAPGLAKNLPDENDRPIQ